MTFINVTTLMDAINDLIRRFESKKPQIVFEWNDSETSAKGWVVINSLKGGAAGGGTRMRTGVTYHEVLSLAKTMEIKFSVAGPAIGGAKSGIDFDPNSPLKKNVLKRWYKAVIPLLKHYYGTGGDMNVDEIDEVIPFTEEHGLWHPQEGIVVGHFNPKDSEKIKKIGQLRLGVSTVIANAKLSPSIEKKYGVADMITGYGVAQSVIQYYLAQGVDYVNKSVIIQGWGNVGAAAGFYLAQAGFLIKAIIDKSGAVINEDGFNFNKVRNLLVDRENKVLTDKNLISFEEGNKKIWDIPADVFIPAAGSRLVTGDQLRKLVNNNLEVIASGANVPFKDHEIFYGETLKKADELVTVIPDFIANCGMARTFAYLMSDNPEVSSSAIFSDVQQKIKEAISEVLSKNKTGRHFTQTALEIAIKKLL